MCWVLLVCGALIGSHWLSLLIRYEIILNCETLDLFYFISGQKPLPPELDLPLMKVLQDYAFDSPLGKADPEQYAAEKKHFSN